MCPPQCQPGGPCHEGATSAGSSRPCGRWQRKTWHSPATSGCCGTSRRQLWGSRDTLLPGGCHTWGYSPPLGRSRCPRAQAGPSCQDDEQEPRREQQRPALPPAAQLTRQPASGEPCSARGGADQHRHPPAGVRGTPWAGMRAGWLGCLAAPLAHGDRHRGCRRHPGTHGSPGTAAPRAHLVRPGHPLARCLLPHSPLPSLGHAIPSPPTQRAPTAGKGQRVGGQHRPWSPLLQLCSGAQERGAQLPTPPAPQSSPPGDRGLEPQQQQLQHSHLTQQLQLGGRVPPQLPPGHQGERSAPAHCPGLQRGTRSSSLTAPGWGSSPGTCDPAGPQPPNRRGRGTPQRCQALRQEEASCLHARGKRQLPTRCDGPGWGSPAPSTPHPSTTGLTRGARAERNPCPPAPCTGWCWQGTGAQGSPASCCASAPTSSEKTSPAPWVCAPTPTLAPSWARGTGAAPDSPSGRGGLPDKAAAGGWRANDATDLGHSRAGEVRAQGLGVLS